LSDINIPDGIGIYLASRLCGSPLPERSTGIDTAEQILKIAEKRSLRVFLLGGKDGIARVAKKNLLRRFPALNICGTHHGYFDEKSEKKVINLINSSRAELLLVCMGFPRQEEWISKNLSSLTSVRVAIGLGGTLDVWANKVRRAPKILQNVGLEWLWRVILEPSRAKIFLDIPRFLLLLVK
jgi:N-acetylglucosaminyldiphosphoundecaprenol N-acetyl-beta-D-mannosaminyltransferase